MARIGGPSYQDEQGQGAFLYCWQRPGVPLPSFVFDVVTDYAGQKQHNLRQLHTHDGIQAVKGQEMSNKELLAVLDIKDTEGQLKRLYELGYRQYVEKLSVGDGVT